MLVSWAVTDQQTKQKITPEGNLNCLHLWGSVAFHFDFFQTSCENGDWTSSNSILEKGTKDLVKIYCIQKKGGEEKKDKCRKAKTKLLHSTRLLKIRSQQIRIIQDFWISNNLLKTNYITTFRCKICLFLITLRIKLSKGLCTFPEFLLSQ